MYHHTVITEMSHHESSTLLDHVFLDISYFLIPTIQASGMSKLTAAHPKVDLNRHGGHYLPSASPPKPVIGEVFDLDSAVIRGS